jgi:putative ABC transport system ATP-binding protein
MAVEMDLEGFLDDHFVGLACDPRRVVAGFDVLYEDLGRTSSRRHPCRLWHRPTRVTLPAVPADALLVADSLVKTYRRGTHEIRALDGVSLQLHAGELVACVGASGSGKSTLLNLLGGLDQPTSGSVCVEGLDLSNLDDDQLTDLRRHRIGFVFQFFNLLPTLSAWENVAVPNLLDGLRLRSSRPRAIELLERMGLADRIDHRPGELSGGELQRVAIARALMGEPVLILADEPTGNLDAKAGLDVLAHLHACATEDGRAVLIVTHDRDAVAGADRVVRIIDGRLDYS